ncbi:thiol:disulfide interchange protein DsbD [Thermonema lapsum]|uniref:Thiol:disulfide interchange protein DsbD n=1 Tax=Thermonema lapsum TaxID=28195 RepID=A0A846MM41_9BACT|nr:cytochrome c biogenesis protein CcdA [Thermonema lapsum]NIK72598.1 thiol:disulfide interchange protein DsbD [Thermonema lapsum]
MIRRLYFLMNLCLWLSAMGVHAQIEKHAHWSHSLRAPKAPQVGDTIEVVFKAKIDPDWYLYASDFDPEVGPMVTEIELTQLRGAKAIGQLLSVNSIKKYDEVFEGQVAIFKKEGTFIQKFIITDTRVSIKGSIHFQVCSDITGMCVPGSYDFSVSVEAQAKGSGHKEESTVNTPTDNRPQAIDSVVSSDAQVMKNIQDGTESTQARFPATPTYPEKKQSLWLFALTAFLAGLAAIFTPCVFPMIPMTVSYFMKGNIAQREGEDQESYRQRLQKARRQGVSRALFYGFSIIGIYVLVGTLAAVFLGAEFANEISTHWLSNLIFFAVFIIFALSFLGMFDITLPTSFLTKVDKQADKGGLVGIFFMALTLVLVSFSCTVPIAGSLLIASAGGEVLKPIVGMLAFSLAFAIPFTFFAAFPTALNKLPRSGGWLNSVKVVLGFIELAFAFKFLSVADQVYHWRLLDREVYLAIWIAIGIALTLYLLGKIQLPHDSPVERLSVPRLLLALLSLSFVIYLIPGMFGAPLEALSGYLPPMSTFNKIEVKGSDAGNQAATNTEFPAKVKYGDLFELPHNLRGFFDYEEAVAYARKVNKPLFIDFTGHGCVNCREMEAKVWSDPRVLKLLRDQYVVVALYVDDKTPLPQSEQYVSPYDGKVKNTIGRKFFDFQITEFGANAQPYYSLLDTDPNKNPRENLLLPPKGYDLNADAFVEFLEKGLEEYRKRHQE